MMMDSAFDFDYNDIPADLANSSRKRSRERSTTPTPKQNDRFMNNDSHHRDNKPSALSTALAARLLDPAQRNAALNELLRASAVNYSLDGDVVLEALTEVVFECLNWDRDCSSGDGGKPVFRPDQAWTAQPTRESMAWAGHCETCLSSKEGHLIDAEQMKCVEAVVVILRNLSFSAANVRLLAFSPDVLAIFVGCLYEGTFSSSPSNLEDSGSSAKEAGNSVVALPALHALVNIAPHLDVTGQKLFCDKLFFSPKNDDAPLMPDPSSFGQAADGIWGFGSLWLAKRLDNKEDVMTDIPKSFLLELTNASNFLVQVWSIFPALSYVFSDPKSPRSLLMMAVDLIQEFVNHARVGAVEKEADDDIPSARAILVNMPDVVLERLIDLLYVPRLGPDCLAYEDPTTNIVTRVNFLKLMMTYEANVDTDMRDRSLDVLVPLLELDSPRMAIRIGINKKGMCRTRLYDALVPILAGNSGRNESSMLGSQMLKELTKAGDENKIGISYIQGRIIEMASRDPRASKLALTHLYPVASAESDTESPEEQEDKI